MPQSAQEAANFLKKAADQGLAEAQYEYGMRCLLGEGVSQSDEEAFKYFKMAAPTANKHFEHVNYQVGLMYETGQGVTQSHSEAIKYYETMGEFERIAQIYLVGKGDVPQSDEKAFHYFSKIANLRSDTTAKYEIGKMYEEGRGGVPQSYKQAVDWYERAANGSGKHGGAMQRLVEIYKSGKGDVPQSDKKVFKYTSEIALGALPASMTQAQYETGKMFEEGKGVSSPSIRGACIYYQSAAARGHGEAANALERIGEKTCEEQIAANPSAFFQIRIPPSM